MTIQDKHIQSGPASQTPNSEMLRKNARGIDEKAVAAEREQLSNLDLNKSGAGSQPRWETEKSASTSTSETTKPSTRRPSETEAISEKADDFKTRAEHMAHDARESVSRAGHMVQEQYQAGAQQARTQISRARSRISNTIDENPLALVAIGVGIGAALGLLLPSTQREDRIMGAQRDRLKAQLMETSAQQLRQARQQLEDTHSAV